jgi:hypothetical protein
MIFEKKPVIGHNMCVLIFSITLPLTFLILKRSELEMIKNVHVEYTLFLSDLNETPITGQIIENIQFKFHENPSIGSRDFPRAGGQTDS